MLVLLWVLTTILLAIVVFFFAIGEKGRFHRSTWAFFRESGPHLRTLHGYIYARWTQEYINALFRLPGSKPGGAAKPTRSQVTAFKAEHWLADHYHGKVLTPGNARSIIKLDRPIERRNMEQIIPFPIARDLILNAPPDIAAFECVCRNGRPNHCEPTQVCMVVGKPFTDMILEHQPGKSHRLTQEEALALLEAEHGRGHVHSAWFKDAMMNRFYAICNCCPCCCGGLRENRRGVNMVASSGYVAQIEQEICTACGECVPSCPFQAISQNDGSVVHDWERCMGCGVCETKCPTGAISMVRDERKGVPLDVTALA